jgi:hypothetical protein
MKESFVRNLVFSIEVNGKFVYERQHVGRSLDLLMYERLIEDEK